MGLRIALIGAGAIGGITAAFMAQSGEDVTMVCKHPEVAKKAAAQGLHITGVRGEHHIPVPSVTDIDDLEGTFDVCLIVTKAYDMPDCARRMLPHLTADSLVVSMQNGICTDTLAEIVGKERTVGCVIGFGATMTGPGEMEMTSTGDFIIGSLVPGMEEKLEPLRKALSAVTPAHISKDIYAELYSKMIVNACITSLGAICGLRLGEMMNRRDARRIFLGVIGEAVDVAKAMRLTLPPYGGKLDYFKLMADDSALDRHRRHLMIWIVGVKYRRLKSSSLQSLERGKPTEVDCFNGYIAQKGREYGVPTPVCDRLVTMIHEEEAGKRQISVANLSDPVFSALR